ncbi:protein C3orf58 precursor, putative [Pediculus humanus corporis]|uniref:Protein C3orf58, putative n=1 Tax=Pediculus humanus subsp. corporis TaxID=121224 RepID=E0W241_PEDHC|nr:protein C3orf58 precursor, putative [Pediculus humanus corporis]EEB19697.1 protein C3orf58 precursor, putative [Pediculus humanus corporis]
MSYYYYELKNSLLLIFNPKLTKSVFYGTLNKTELVVVKRKTRFDSLQLLYKNVVESVKKNQLWSFLDVSIEPLLMLSLGKSGFPKYIGACGDFLVEEYKGLPLDNFLSCDFKTRALLSIKLLNLANFFTFSSSDFIFYFTDISLYNIVVDEHGNVSLVDLDNVIIFDKKSQKSSSVKAKIHKTEIWNDNDDDYSFSSSDICSHYLSDHNYYSICTHILSHSDYGLLKEIPRTITNLNPDLEFLLNECKKPTKINDRVTAGEKLAKLLEKITVGYSWQHFI